MPTCWSVVMTALCATPRHARPGGRFGASACHRSLHRDPEGRERKPEAPARRRREADGARNREGGRSDRGIFGHHETAHGAEARARQTWLTTLAGNVESGDRTGDAPEGTLAAPPRIACGQSLDCRQRKAPRVLLAGRGAVNEQSNFSRLAPPGRSSWRCASFDGAETRRPSMGTNT